MAKKKYFAFRQRECASNGMTVYKFAGIDRYLLEQNPFSKSKGAWKRWNDGIFWEIKGKPKKLKGYKRWNYTGTKWKRLYGGYFVKAI